MTAADKLDITQRIAIGGAQFGMDYGVANESGRVSASGLGKILCTAREHGIDTVDTAVNYGRSEDALGKAGVADWRIVSKLPEVPGLEADLASWIRNVVEMSLRRLGVDHLEGLLLHRPSDILGARQSELLDALNRIRDDGLVRCLGYSVYDPEVLDRLTVVMKPEIVQAPLNVLDRRLIRTGWLAKLTKLGARVHVRSVFLQGLLLMTPSSRPDFFQPWNDRLDRWEAWCRDSGLTRLQAAIGFVLSKPEVDRIIVGVDSHEQLVALLKAAESGPVSTPGWLETRDRTLIDPSCWRLA